MLSDLNGILKDKPKADKKDVEKVRAHITKGAKGILAVQTTTSNLKKLIADARKALGVANKARLNQPDAFDWGGKNGTNAALFSNAFGQTLVNLNNAVRVYSNQSQIVVRDMAAVAGILKMAEGELSVTMFTKSDAIDKKLPTATKKLMDSGKKLILPYRSWNDATARLKIDQKKLAAVIKGLKSIKKKPDLTKNSIKLLSAKAKDLDKSLGQLKKFNDGVFKVAYQKAFQADMAPK